MATEERVARGAERCSVHPTRPTVARCDRCERPLCLSCAVPVRGRVLGPECLVTEIGPDPSIPQIPRRDPAKPARIAVAVAFAAALVASALPWSRFGAGSEAFGAWSDKPAWSMLAALAAATGVALSLVRLFARRGPAILDLVSALLGAAIAFGCVLALFRPRPFTSPWLGPWIALAAGVAATTASIAARARARERADAHI